MKQKTFIMSLMLVGLTFASCSDDDTAPAVTPTFPESIENTLKPDEKGELKFNASLAWQLTSDKVWLKFLTKEGNPVQYLADKAGEYTVSYTVTTGAQGFFEDEAVITLKQGDEERVIATVKRIAKERIVKMYKQASDGSRNIEEVEAQTDTQFDIQKAEHMGFMANFDWKLDLESLPAWIIEDESNTFRLRNLSGEAGQATDFDHLASFDVVLTERYRDLDGFITIRDMDSDYTYQFPIHAPAIKSGEIHWVGLEKDIKGGLTWDGQGTLVSIPPLGGAATWLPGKPATCHAVIRDNEYTVRVAEWDEALRKATEISLDQAWVKIEKQEGGKLTLKPNDFFERGVTRKLTLFLIPEGVEVTDLNDLYESYGYLFAMDKFGIPLTQYGLTGGFGIGARTQVVVDGYPKTVFKNKIEATEVANATEVIEKLGLVQTNNIYEYTLTAEDWDAKNELGKELELGVMPLGMELLGNWQMYQLYNSKFDPLDMNKPEGWATPSAYWKRQGSYPEVGQYSYFLNMTGRLPYAEITDDCLYVVFSNGTKDLGTIILRKQ